MIIKFSLFFNPCFHHFRPLHERFKPKNWNDPIEQPQKPPGHGFQTNNQSKVTIMNVYSFLILTIQKRRLQFFFRVSNWFILYKDAIKIEMNHYNCCKFCRSNCRYCSIILHFHFLLKCFHTNFNLSPRTQVIQQSKSRRPLECSFFVLWTLSKHPRISMGQSYS